MKSDRAILFLHPGAEWYGADKILFNTVMAARSEWRCIVCLPESGILKRRLEAEGVEVVVIPFPALRRRYFSLGGLVRYSVEFMVTFPKLAGICRERRVGLVHSNTLAILQGVALKLILRTRHVWHVHEIILRPRGFTAMLRLAASLGADRVVAVSEAVSRAFGAPRTVLIYNGIDPLDRESVRPRPGPVSVGMLGRFNSWKGQIDLLRAIESLYFRGLVPSSFDRFVFCGGVFAGDTTHLDAFRRHLETSPVRSMVELLDFTEDVASIYKKLDVFVLPSVLPDPFPTVVLEAMSMGLPIVAYHHGGVVEMLGEEGAFAAPGDVEGLAEAIMKVGLDEARLRIAGDLSRLRFDEFSSRRFKNAFLGCYSEVAAGSD